MLTIFVAKSIITMDVGRPRATAVAVLDGRIVSVGNLATMRPWLDRHPHTIDERFADKILCPGFIDPHTHFRWSSSLFKLHYVGPIASPNGIEPAVTTREAVMARLAGIDAALADPQEPIFAWGFDPVVHGGHLHRDELDRISGTRPISVLAYAIHFTYANSGMLAVLGATDDMVMHGLGRYDDGRLNGQFIEFEANHFAMAPFRDSIADRGSIRSGMRLIGRTACASGITTTGELALGISDFDAELEDYQAVSEGDDFPVRVVLIPTAAAMQRRHGDGAAVATKALSARSTDKLRFHGIKLWTDGSYQALSLRVKFPGFLDRTNGLRGDVPWDQLTSFIRPYWEIGVQVHVHAIGDEALDAALDSLDELQMLKPRFDHRLTIEHYSVSSTAQARRLARLGGCASVNIYLVHYRAEAQGLQGLGPDRAEATARLGSLEREGVVFGLHSDYALVVVPMRPLIGMWIATRRLGADGGTVLSPGECIGLERAMRAVTIDAAFLLRLENEIGSIEVGKRADFAVLEDDPFGCGPDGLPTIKVWGTVFGGVAHQATETGTS